MTERTLTTERLYSLGDFKNIKFSSTISGIPEAVSLDAESVRLLYYLQLIEIEHTFSVYKGLMKNVVALKDDELAIKFLDEERTETFEKLIAKIQENSQPK